MFLCILVAGAFSLNAFAATPTTPKPVPAAIAPASHVMPKAHKAIHKHHKHTAAKVETGTPPVK
jgi:hypothetical protein